MSEIEDPEGDRGQHHGGAQHQQEGEEPLADGLKEGHL